MERTELRQIEDYVKDMEEMKVSGTSFWKRLGHFFVIVVVLLIGIWLIYSYATHLPSPDEIAEVKRLYEK